MIDVNEEVIFTLEFDSPEDEAGVLGTRHKVCAGRTDVFFCVVLEEPPVHPPDDRECWGCSGWLDEPSLTIEQTAELHRLWEESAE